MRDTLALKREWAAAASAPCLLRHGFSKQRCEILDDLLDTVEGLSLSERMLLRASVAHLLVAGRRARRVESHCCIGLATQNGATWWPDGNYWPPNAPREWTVVGLVRALESEGWERTDSREVEAFRMKIAVFGHKPLMAPNHVVSLEDVEIGKEGRWLSKTSFLEPLAFSWEECCTLFGEPMAVLRKWRSPGRRCE